VRGRAAFGAAADPDRQKIMRFAFVIPVPHAKRYDEDNNATASLKSLLIWRTGQTRVGAEK